MFKNISIKYRLIFLFSFLNLMLLVLAVFAYVGSNKLLQDSDNIYQGGPLEMFRLHALSSIINQDIIRPLNELRNGTLTSSEGENLFKDAFKKSTDELLVYFHDLESAFKEPAIELQLLMNQSQKEVYRILDLSNKDASDGLTQEIEKAFYLLSQVNAKISDLMKMHYEITTQEFTKATADSQVIKFWLYTILILSTLIAAIFTGLIIKSISKPLAEAVEAVERLAIGDSSMNLSDAGQNEAGQLVQAVQNMTDTTKKMSAAITAFASGDLKIEVSPRSDKDTIAHALNHMVASMKKMGAALVTVATGDLSVEVPIRSEKDTVGKALNHMVSSLKKMLSQIQFEVNALTTSTQEIATSINQVSTGTSESMAAVTETTATVEELKQTAHVSADKAKNVLTCAEETLAEIQKGEKTLHLTVDEMDQIAEKMRTISQSIVKLSEHSTAIGEIINTVNNLAEQSNLLAVNAAIEAAKAGDQGKSFNVVAQEIRSLAEHSKAATVQVRSILSDIQNATSAAILATEQGSKAVAKGVLQSNEMAAGIHALTASISRVSMAANQISISSQQQLVGVDQVTVAMANISEATNQHVEQMRQIEDAVSNLNAVALNLKELVNLYKMTNKADREVSHVNGLKFDHSTDQVFSN